jgi:hypothetical protein
MYENRIMKPANIVLYSREGDWYKVLEEVNETKVYDMFVWIYQWNSFMKWIYAYKTKTKLGAKFPIQ